MNICVCVDDSMGMSFGGRRLSRDRVLIERLLSHTEYDRIYVSSYSLPLFSEYGDARVTVTSDLACAGKDDLCFMELEHITEYSSEIDRILMYRWNRRYPSDRKFPFLPEQKGYRKVSEVDFTGSSHDRITEEEWIR